MLLAAMGLVGSAGFWVGLKIGRPVYYSDGNVEVTAADLRNSGMVRWSSPQPEFEIPGPVRGRVTALPDGRLIYGKVMGPQVTDLVLFDPEHPTDPVQPVIELNSPGHDLSPLLGPMGRLYFASDRPSGPGGFDIYAATYRDGLFFAPRPLPEGINSGLDESDPTIDSGGGQLVFVRRDPEVADGHNGKLMTASFAAPDAARPVFPDEDASKYRRELTPPVDRDPMLAPDGVGLYFVRQTEAGVTSLMRTSWHVDHYVQPMSVEALQIGGPFRGPTLVDDGFGMRLVSAAKRVNPADGESVETVIVFRAEAREVYPFWEGQWWLEWLLLYLVFFFALILVLLTLGARWSSMDFITKLVMLSVLIHLLLLLWLSGMKIVRSFQPRGPDTGSVQVHLVSQRAVHGDTDSTTSPSQNKVDVSESLSFEGHEESMEVKGPEVEVAKNDRALEATKNNTRPSYTPNRKSEDAKVQDRAKDVALRAAAAPEKAPDRKQIKIDAETKNQTTADRRSVAAEEIKVVVPGSDSAITSHKPSPERNVASAAPRRVLPSARNSSARATVADAPVEPRKRLNAAESAGAAANLRAVAASPVALNRSAKPTPERESNGEVGMQKAVPVKNTFAEAPRRRVTKDAGEASTPRPREIVARARRVEDAPQVNTKSGAAAPAEATLAKSVGTDLNQAPRRVDVARQERPSAKSDVAVPRSNLANPERAAQPVAVAARDLPTPTDPLVGSKLALADSVQPPAAETLRKRGAEALSRIDAKDLESVRPERKVSEVERGERTGVDPAPLELSTPESMVARGVRRDVATNTRAHTELRARQSISPVLAGAVALRDDADQTNTKSGAAAPAEATLAKSVGTDLNQAPRRVDVARQERPSAKSDVAVPRSNLANPERAAQPVAVAARDLPTPTDPLVGSKLALADSVQPPAAETLRKRGAEALSRIDAKDLESVRPERKVSEVERGERTGVDPAPLELSTPESMVARGVRRDVATNTRAHTELRARQSISPVLAGAVALRDDAGQTSSAPIVETTESELVATSNLKKVDNPAAMTAPQAVRGNSGTMHESRDLTTPGSLLERHSRRAVAVEQVAERQLRSAGAILVDAVALRDDAVVGKSAVPTERVDGVVGTSGRPERSKFAELQQRNQGVLDRPKRDHHRGGLHDVSIGIVPPGSFLARAGVGPEVPVIVATAEELTPYSNRFGEKKLAALKKYGGTVETERAVRRGLAYLASIQNENGMWGDPRASQRKYGQVSIGKTGLCLLAFLGAGHTPDSDTKYSEVARRAVDALLATQRQSAHFGVSTAYSHGITTYALAECYALTKSKKLRRPIERAMRWILAKQNDGRDKRNRGGWGYFSSALRAEDSYSRSSTTAWQVMALESAKLSGIEVPEDALTEARDYLLSNYDRRYRYFLYNKEPSRLRSEWRTLPASTPAAVFCLQLLGMDASERRLEAGLNYTLDRAPEAYRRYSEDDFVLKGAGNVYFWYYSTLACFMAGGEMWDEWNKSLKKVLLSGQNRDGSFPIIDSYAKYAGDSRWDRSYTTAMCVLSLEVYYRYFTPLLKKGK